MMNIIFYKNESKITGRANCTKSTIILSASFNAKHIFLKI